jgi:hypothetical protein
MKVASGVVLDSVGVGGRFGINAKHSFDRIVSSAALSLIKDAIPNLT